DRQLRATGAASCFAAGMAAAYSRLSPPLAGWLRRRPRAAAAVRALVLSPLVTALQLGSSRTRRWPRLRSVLLALTFVLTVAVPVAAVALALWAWWPRW